MTRVKREMRFRNCDKGGALGLVGAAFHAKQCNAMQCPALLLHRITIMQGCLWRDGSVHGPFRSAMWRAMRWCMLVKQFGCHFQEHKGHTFYFSRASSPKKIHWSSPCTNTRTPPLVFKDYYRKAINLLLLPDHNPWKLKTFRIQSLNMTSSSTDFCSPGTDSVSLRAIVQYCPSFYSKVRISTWILMNKSQY